MLTFPILDHAQVLECGDDVAWVDAPLFSKGLDTELLGCGRLAEVLQQHVFPVGPVGKEPHVAERFLGTAHLALDSAQLVTEVYQGLAVTLSLVRWQGQDT